MSHRTPPESTPRANTVSPAPAINSTIRATSRKASSPNRQSLSCAHVHARSRRDTHRGPYSHHLPAIVGNRFPAPRLPQQSPPPDPHEIACTKTDPDRSGGAERTTLTVPLENELENNRGVASGKPSTSPVLPARRRRGSGSSTIGYHHPLVGPVRFLPQYCQKAAVLSN